MSELFIPALIILLATLVTHLIGKWKTRPVEYQLGMLNEKPARLNLRTGSVQFVLWPAGENGQKEDFWIEADRYWWDQFISDDWNPTPKDIQQSQLPMARIINANPAEVG